MIYAFHLLPPLISNLLARNRTRVMPDFFFPACLRDVDSPRVTNRIVIGRWDGIFGSPCWNENDFFLTGVLSILANLTFFEVRLLDEKGFFFFFLLYFFLGELLAKKIEELIFIFKIEN